MSSIDFPENPPDAPSFTPTTDDPLPDQDAFDLLQQQLDDAPTGIDLVVAADPPRPVGRSWAFDWQRRSFVRPIGARGPKATYGLETLTQWIEKCLRTARGAHPVHPPGYGFVEPQGGLVGNRVGLVAPDLEDRIRDALSFHPNISEVGEVDFDFDPDGDYLHVSFSITLDDNRQLELQNLRLNVGL